MCRGARAEQTDDVVAAHGAIRWSDMGTGASYTRFVRSHEWIDQRSLALHDRVATKLEADPQLLEEARANVERWLRSAPSAPLLEWRHLLQVTPLPRLLELLRSRSEMATRLRQSSPFAGLLTPDERLAILRRYESRRA